MPFELVSKENERKRRYSWAGIHLSFQFVYFLNSVPSCHLRLMVAPFSGYSRKKVLRHCYTCPKPRWLAILPEGIVGNWTPYFLRGGWFHILKSEMQINTDRHAEHSSCIFFKKIPTTKLNRLHVDWLKDSSSSVEGDVWFSTVKASALFYALHIANEQNISIPKV